MMDISETANCLESLLFKRLSRKKLPNDFALRVKQSLQSRRVGTFEKLYEKV